MAKQIGNDVQRTTIVQQMSRTCVAQKVRVHRWKTANLRVLRADAAFAKPEICEALEKRAVKYAIRLPENLNLLRDIEELLARPVGWLLLAEGHLNRRRFGAMLGRTARLPVPTG